MEQKDAVSQPTSQSIQPSKERSLSREVFDKGMIYLEAGKQDNFSADTLSVWYNEMVRMGWTEAQFHERVRAVLHSQTYGRITFDMFLNSPIPEPPAPHVEMAHCGEHNVDYRKYIEDCPKCKARYVPMPGFVKDQIRALEEEMKVKKEKA